MNITSVVAVADLQGIDEPPALVFEPGHPYPVQAVLHLRVHGQPFPQTEPTRVVPNFAGVTVSYGRELRDQSPPGFEPADHYFRELALNADYRPGPDSWHVEGDEARVALVVSIGLRDNSPAGMDSPPDDPFVAWP
ncbi:MAG: hypothetical protein ACTHLH_11210, partial [Solirubrobacterales bacterium]